jgi:hypothetical protein
MIEIRFDKTKDEVALLIWFLVDHSVFIHIIIMKKCLGYVYTSGVMTSAQSSVFHQIRFPIHHIFAQHKCSTQKKTYD